MMDGYVKVIVDNDTVKLIGDIVVESDRKFVEFKPEDYTYPVRKWYGMTYQWDLNNIDMDYSPWATYIEMYGKDGLDQYELMETREYDTLRQIVNLLFSSNEVYLNPAQSLLLAKIVHGEYK